MSESARQVRGSGLLVGGRFIAIVVNLAVQVVTVRYLSQTEYGAFAYALSLVATLETLSTLGLDRTVSRYVPMYHENGDVARVYGTLLTIVATVAAVGTATVVVLIAGASFLIDRAGSDVTLRTLVVILAALGPVQAIDHMLENMLASFGRAGAIVVRRHLLGPLLKLAAVIGVVTIAADVEVLAIFYLVAGVVGVALYVPLLVRTLREAGLLVGLGTVDIQFPVAELFAFALPLLALDIALVARTTLDAIVVQAFHGTQEVALLKSVQPIARLNQLVFSSFAILFTPMAARLVARRDHEELHDLYWQSAIWQALVSFPIAAATIVLAPELSTLLFGAEYRDAAPVLSILALGYYVNAATGQNQLTLRVFGRVRALVVGGLAAGILTLALDLALVPGLAATGAAIATAVGLICLNVYNQVAMHRATTVGVAGRRIILIYVALGAGLVAVLVLHHLLGLGLIGGLLLVGAGSVGLVVAFRHDVRLGATFPELRRLPLVGRWL